MALASKLTMKNLPQLASVAFYGVAGVVLLALMAVNGFPPDVALLGLVSVIAAYGLFMRRGWALWLVVALFFVATTFSLFTLYFVVATDALATAGMVAYAVLTWVFTALVIIRRKAKAD